MREIQCHTCSQLVPQNKFHGHVSRHLLTNNKAPDPSKDTSATQRPAASIPPYSPAVAHNEPSPNTTLFQKWNSGLVDNPTELYTTIDGRVRGPGLRDPDFIQDAQVLREMTKSKVIKIVQEFKGLSESNKRTCIDLVRDTPVLPGLVAYIYTHLIACPPRGWILKADWTALLSQLKRDVTYWRARGELACVLFYDLVKSSLVQILDATRVLSEHHKCNLALLNETMIIEPDVQNLAALVALCITGPEKDRILLTQGTEAANLVELLHALLDSGVELEDWCRRCLFDTLIVLSKATGHCPRGLYLRPGAISDLKPRGQGGYGIVYQGNIGSRAVAVKYLKGNYHTDLDAHKKDFCKEAIVWKHLRHPNCLPLYGVYSMDGDDGSTVTTALVSPWMAHGTLFDYLKSKWDTAQRTLLILDIVSGLNYLHSMRPHIAHRDIKPDNILVTKNGRACLADFGFASVFDVDSHFHTATAHLAMGGTPHYMAPEIFSAITDHDKRKVNKRLCDMYALGCTIYAIYTLRHPFDGIRLPAQIRDNVATDRRPEFPEGQISLEMWDFVQRLWDAVPSKRPTADRALSWMRFMADKEGLDTSPPIFEEEWLWKGSCSAGLLSIASA